VKGTAMICLLLLLPLFMFALLPCVWASSYPYAYHDPGCHRTVYLVHRDAPPPQAVRK
jgi:hypothetical protein